MIVNADGQTQNIVQMRNLFHMENINKKGLCMMLEYDLFFLLI